MRFALGFLTALLVVAPVPETVETTQLVVRQVPGETVVVEAERERYTPAGFDVDEAERQGMCLWEWMRQEDWEITLDMVMAAGVVTDLAGGACRLIGED